MYLRGYDKIKFNQRFVSSNKFRSKPDILVLSGGGLNGFSHIGAIQALNRIGLLNNINTFAGTSIGALICGLLVIGYTPKEIENFSLKFHFDKLMKINFSNLMESYGLDDGSRVDYVLKTLIREKLGIDNITLNELYQRTHKILITVSTCIDDKKTYYFHYQSEPNIPLHLAIRISMCLPLLYTPIKYNNKYFVDGGCTNNYPIGLFKHRLSHVIGIFIYNDSCTTHMTHINDYIQKLISVMIDNGYRIAKKYNSYTIWLVGDYNNTIAFRMSKSKKRELINYGFNTCIKKLVLEI